MHLAKRFIQLKTGIHAPFDVVCTDYEDIRGARNIAQRVTRWRGSHHRLATGWAPAGNEGPEEPPHSDLYR